MPSRPGSYRTPFWCTLEVKDKGTWLASYKKVWGEVRVSSAGDNEVFLSLSKEQGSATLEEVSLVGAAVNARPVDKHPHYCEVALAPPLKRTIKIMFPSEGDRDDLLKTLAASIAGIAIER